MRKERNVERENKQRERAQNLMDTKALVAEQSQEIALLQEQLDNIHVSSFALRVESCKQSEYCQDKCRQMTGCASWKFLELL